MEHHLPQNIRAMRKARGFTQEQLAEAMGVTVGAVSKWELGQSAPDLSTLMELADFFDASVDALLGYTLRENSAELAAKRIRALRNARRFDEARSEAEKALQKYPNHFNVVMQSASAYSLSALERDDPVPQRRALALYQHALTLLGQNTDPEISEVSISNDIAVLHLALGETEKALEVWRKYNYDGLNDAAIGMTLAAHCKKPDEALPVLSNALVNSIIGIIRVVNGYINAYAQKENPQQALQIALWCCAMVDGLRPEGAVCALDKLEAAFLGFCASAALDLHDETAARGYLRRAAKLANAFDRAPTYAVGSIRFYCGKDAQVSDDLGQTAQEAVEHALRESADHAQTLLTLWQEVKEELQ
ncbi:MAG: helix-turn-helix domain-containing protein [Oscillospiraceae bacterium]